jgi:hypothetical protein
MRRQVVRPVRQAGTQNPAGNVGLHRGVDHHVVFHESGRHSDAPSNENLLIKVFWFFFSKKNLLLSKPKDEYPDIMYHAVRLH